MQERTLPVYPAGSVDVPYVIADMDELVADDTRWGEHSHPTHELLWNERGTSTASIGPRTWTITPMVGLWIPAGVLHAGLARAGTWYRAAQFDVRDAPALADEPVAVKITPLLGLLLERLRDTTLTSASRGVTESMVLDVLAPSPHALVVHAPKAELLRPVVDALRQDPGDQRTLAEWSRALGASTRTISRAFLAETGLGFSGWVGTLRAHRAVELLVAGSSPEEVAAATGYASVSAFGAAFRRVTGLTPGSFRHR
ncbi:AraC family transcriptional regulator [Amycolatopsis antarctica]|uniref:AraC family transcriptional regulator n=1 Tax=Amycolatopsis antarctica TaxID=1854586 RepID=A0A263D0I7_9PSEU|nr:AraC family transcriptional regulator [Amycolatopsis antarctica]OZM71964.1 AraC family transcriptional regulator [Amycolatopsis antarctica]